MPTAYGEKNILSKILFIDFHSIDEIFVVKL